MRIPRAGRYGTWLALLAIGASGAANAQAQTNFSVPVNGGVWSLALQPDHKVLIGGLSVNSLAGRPCQNLGRLNSDGTLDLKFHPRGAFDVTGLGVQADGKILVGGYVTNLAGQICTNLARLNPDGSADSSFNSPNPNEVVWAFCIQPDGKILLAGAFTSLAGSTQQYVARINTDGTLDQTFKPVADAPVIAVALQPDGKILVGGVTALNGHPRNGLGRLNSDGSLDLAFNPAVGGGVWSMALQGDGKVLVASTNTVRFNSDGTLDTNFKAVVPVNSFALQADGKILTLSGSVLARLNADGGLDTSFASYTNSGGYSLALQQDGQIVFAFGGGAIEGRTNTELSSSILTYQNTTASWSLGSTSPGVATAAFDYTTNGIEWISLGEGMRTTEGWQLSGITVPPASTLRVRGGVSGGFFNGSFWFAQSFLGKPAILLPPLNVANYAGLFGQLSINAGGSEPLLYQWFKDGTELPGATNSALAFSALSAADAATYQVALSNQFGRITSSSATVTVLPPPEIATNDNRLGFTNGQFGFNIHGLAGQPVVVEWTRNFMTWVPARTNFLDGGSYYFSEFPPTNRTLRFYRLRAIQ